MDVNPTITTTTTAATVNTNTNTTAAMKSPEADSETPTGIQPSKPISLSNGLLKRHNPHHQQYHHHQLPSSPLVVTYKECLKNHVASLGGHALDGCGEFVPSHSATSADLTSLECAACGCHRNFHRRKPEDPIPTSTETHVTEYQPHHRPYTPPPPPPASDQSLNLASPTPISSSYPFAPHVLLDLSGGLPAPPESAAGPTNAMLTPTLCASKRSVTKLTQGQKEKMCHFAERVGWKVQKRDEELVREFCSEVGVQNSVLKVWMHNNKNKFVKRDINGGRDSNILEHTPTHTRNNGNGNTNGISQFHLHSLSEVLPSLCFEFWCVAMAMATFVAALLLALIAISMLQTMAVTSHGQGGHHYDNANKYGPGSLKSYQCSSQCLKRCSQTQYHKPCMFFCQKCCKKCLCVPPGYYGNKAVCPCYNNWKTKEGGPNCP